MPPDPYVNLPPSSQLAPTPLWWNILLYDDPTLQPQHVHSVFILFCTSPSIKGGGLVLKLAYNTVNHNVVVQYKELIQCNAGVAKSGDC